MTTNTESIRKALEAAREFIRNGVEFGYIRMPDTDTPDSAHDTPKLIDEALAALQSQPDELPPLPTSQATDWHPFKYTADQMREYALQARASLPVQQEPIAWAAKNCEGFDYIAEFREAVNDHINEAMDMEAGRAMAPWHIVPLYAAPPTSEHGLLRHPSEPLPRGCYCNPGKCAAPKPEWCRDHTKRDSPSQPASKQEPECRVGNFGDSTEAQINRMISNVPLPNYTANPDQAKQDGERVEAICDAYESGVGHGQKLDGLNNGKEYYADDDCALAYTLGYEHGKEHPTTSTTEDKTDSNVIADASQMETLPDSDVISTTAPAQVVATIYLPVSIATGEIGDEYIQYDLREKPTGEEHAVTDGWEYRPFNVVPLTRADAVPADRNAILDEAAYVCLDFAYGEGAEHVRKAADAINSLKSAPAAREEIDIEITKLAVRLLSGEGGK
jgi:hypothetical protein